MTEPSTPAPPEAEPSTPAAPEPVGPRSTRTETRVQWFDADGKLTGESTTVARTYLADDLPFPSDGYL